ncbi:methionine--tRNA ligase [Candidatus Acetothermia bacterium]|nr:MAG: methionine--tRNA ligase [Candidatus Acetothermia bacterium]
MNKKRVLVCSAWPYASGVPHLGNLVSSLLSGDVFTRYWRMRGRDVLYVSGSDVHGTRIEYEARQLGIPPAKLAKKNHEKIVKVIKGFGIEFDNYTITESPVHVRFVQDIYLKMENNGYIVTKEENRAYCRNCRIFLADRFITGTCPHCGYPHAMGNQCDSCGAILEPEELIDPVCSFCGESDIEFRPTKHWYLDLEKLAPKLREYVASRDFQGNVRLFTERMIEEGLKPRAMTRDISWGIPAPFRGAEGKVIYVWGEAALGYVSAVIEHFEDDPRWKDFWFGDDVHQIYTMAKDNIPFHTLIFPGQLIASGEGYHLPDQIAATEYLNWVRGESFSKSRGIGLYCDDALEVMDPEYWRFYLLYNRPEGRDVYFSFEELEKAINGVLISNVANLFNRVISFIQTRHAGNVPDAELDPEVSGKLTEAAGVYERAFEAGSLGQALRAACSLAVFGNGYFQRKKPWETGDPAALASAVHLVKGVAVLLYPYIPRFAGRVLAILGIDKPRWEDIERQGSRMHLSDERIILERIEIESIRSAIDGKEAPGRPTVPYDEFAKLDIRVGVIREAEEIPAADRLYRLRVDFGTEVKTCVAGIKGSYSAEELIDRQVVAIVNLEPRTVRGVRSECMLLAAGGEPLSLLRPDRSVEPGTAVN